MSHRQRKAAKVVDAPPGGMPAAGSESDAATRILDGLLRTAEQQKQELITEFIGGRQEGDKEIRRRVGFGPPEPGAPSQAMTPCLVRPPRS